MADKFTILRQLGYYGTEAEMLAKFQKDITGLDTVGEQIWKALDRQSALDALGIDTSGTPSDIAVPGGLAATGTPGPDTFLAGDGAWKAVAAGSVTADTAGIVGSTAVGISVLTAANQAAAQTAIGAIAASLLGTANGVAQLGPTSLLNPAYKPPEWASQDDVQNAVDQVFIPPPDISSLATKAEVNQKANAVVWNGTSWPEHIITPSMTVYYGGPAAPLPDGNNVTGGGGMVPGLDIWMGVLLT